MKTEGGEPLFEAATPVAEPAKCYFLSHASYIALWVFMLIVFFLVLAPAAQQS